MGKFDLGQFFGLQSKGHVALDPYEQIRPLLRQYATGGFPEWKDQWQSQWDLLKPQIQETYQARRGLGAGSTPEVSALGQAGSKLMSGLSQQDLMGRLQALLGFGRTPLQFGPRATTPGQNLMAMLLPLLSSFLGAGGFFDMSAGGTPTVTGGGGGGGLASGQGGAIGGGTSGGGASATA